MLKIKNVTAKNFMSVGNNTQAVSFDTDSAYTCIRTQFRLRWRW